MPVRALSREELADRRRELAYRVYAERDEAAFAELEQVRAQLHALADDAADRALAAGEAERRRRVARDARITAIVDQWAERLTAIGAERTAKASAVHSRSPMAALTEVARLHRAAYALASELAGLTGDNRRFGRSWRRLDDLIGVDADRRVYAAHGGQLPTCDTPWRADLAELRRLLDEQRREVRS
jgi:hypothetical protein